LGEDLWPVNEGAAGHHCQFARLSMWPNYLRHDVILEVIKRSRTVAEGAIFARYPHIIRDATEAQRQRKMGEPMPLIH
jgi:hypothetical protein